MLLTPRKLELAATHDEFVMAGVSIRQIRDAEGDFWHRR
jgi:hypothetical protein